MHRLHKPVFYGTVWNRRYLVLNFPSFPDTVQRVVVIDSRPALINIVQCMLYMYIAYSFTGRLSDCGIDQDSPSVDTSHVQYNTLSQTLCLCCKPLTTCCQWNHTPSFTNKATSLACLRRFHSNCSCFIHSGNDFAHEKSLDVDRQVQLLIEQATSHENLCQCYIGWCPFW